MLEAKLDETRLQLAEIKTTWSDKISHLENQISNLNSKIVEDSEELMSSRAELEVAKEAHQGEVRNKNDKKIQDAHAYLWRA